MEYIYNIEFEFWSEPHSHPDGATACCTWVKKRAPEVLDPIACILFGRSGPLFLGATAVPGGQALVVVVVVVHLNGNWLH